MTDEAIEKDVLWLLENASPDDDVMKLSRMAVAEIIRLRASVERLVYLREEDGAYASRLVIGHQIAVDELRQQLAYARSSHQAQVEITLSFREDWLREKERADALEARLEGAS